MSQPLCGGGATTGLAPLSAAEKTMQLNGAGFPVAIAGAFRHACGAAAVFALAGAATAFAQNTGSNEGSHVFMQSGCFACHGEQGFGGVGPRFRDDPFLGITDYVVAQILLGRGVMPSFANKLDDQQIAAVASYIRTSWGNHFGDVKPQQVAQVRQTIQQEYNLMGSSQPNPGPSNLPAPQQK